MNVIQNRNFISVAASIAAAYHQFSRLSDGYAAILAGEESGEKSLAYRRNSLAITAMEMLKVAWASFFVDAPLRDYGDSFLLSLECKSRMRAMFEERAKRVAASHNIPADVVIDSDINAAWGALESATNIYSAG